MIKKLSVCLLVLAGLFGCASPQTRQVAEVSENKKMEAEFQALLNAPNANELAIAKMDKLFTLLLKANLFVDKFSQELDSKIAFKKKNPAAAIPEISQSAPYKNLLKAWNLKERYSSEIEYLYSRALEVRADFATSEDQKHKTRSLLKSVTTYAKTSQNLKRIEFQPLLANLAEIYRKQVISYKSVLKEQGLIKDVSAISEVPEYENLIFADEKELVQYAKTAKEKASTLLAQPKYKKFTMEVDADLNEIADPVFDRAPQAVNQDLSCKNGKKLCVSTGENGSLFGGIFPKGVWAFTYDDGPTPAFTSEIMDHFINYKDSQNSVGKATFFWTAKHFDSNHAAYLTANQEMVKKAIGHGFVIANHSYDHADLNRSTTDRIKQIITSNNILETAIRREDPSYKIQYFRCPYGSCYAPKIPAVRQMLVDQGQMHVYWRLDSLDWKLKDSAKASELVMKQMQLYDHGVILMHDVQPTTPETTRLVLKWMKDQNDNKGKNYKMVTIPEAVDLINGK